MSVVGVIEVQGFRADFDSSRHGSTEGGAWRCEDPLILVEIQILAEKIGCPHNFVDIGNAMHVQEVARRMGGRVISLTGHEGPFPPHPLDDLPGVIIG